MRPQSPAPRALETWSAASPCGAASLALQRKPKGVNVSWTGRCFFPWFRKPLCLVVSLRARVRAVPPSPRTGWTISERQSTCVAWSSLPRRLSMIGFSVGDSAFVTYTTCSIGNTLWLGSNWWCFRLSLVLGEAVVLRYSIALCCLLAAMVFFSIWSGPLCDFFVSRLQAFGLLSPGSASTPSPSPSSFPAFLLGALATIGTFQRVADKLVVCRTVRPSPRRISRTRVSRR